MQETQKELEKIISRSSTATKEREIRVVDFDRTLQVLDDENKKSLEKLSKISTAKHFEKQIC